VLRTGLMLLVKGLKEDRDRIAIAALNNLADQAHTIARNLRNAATRRQLAWVKKLFPVGSDVRIHATCEKADRPMSKHEQWEARGTWRVVRWTGGYDDLEVVVERVHTPGNVRFFPLQCVSK
jgi:hypothetical protein